MELWCFLWCQTVQAVEKTIELPVMHNTIWVATQWLPYACISNFNSVWPSDAICGYKSGSKLAQIMACCLMAPSHCLNQCWLLISEVLWHSHESKCTANVHIIILCNEFKNYVLKINVASPKGHQVKYVYSGIQNTTRSQSKYIY